jgi:geranylgeranylglycerol-phosphate geranylgeranyltransferase
VIVGAMIGRYSGPSAAGTIAGLSAALIAGGVNTLNDCFDIEADTINRPERPIPSGTVGKIEALVAGWGLMGGGILLSWALGALPLMIAAGCSTLAILYSIALKRTPIVGNVVVSLVSGLPFLYGGAVVENAPPSLIPTGFACLFHLGRELIKDVEDREGDEVAEEWSFAVRYGVEASYYAVAIVYTVLIAATLLPFLFGIYGLGYLITVIFGVDAVILYVLRSLWHDRSRQNWGRISRLLKVDMVVGMGAILIGVYG